MAKTYLSKGTRTKHTYEFYKDRQDNPQWRDDFLRVRLIRRRMIILRLLFVILVIGIIGVLGSHLIGKRTTKSDHNAMVSSSTSSLVKQSESNSTNGGTNESSSVNSKEDQETIVGKYSVPIENLNGKNFKGYYRDALGTGEDTSLLFSLNNQSGDGTMTETLKLKSGESVINKYVAHYQEIETKKISAQNDQEVQSKNTRQVKVNTEIVVDESDNNSRRIYYAFSNNSGGITVSLAGRDTYGITDYWG
ncbi:hypothetical protein ACE83Q_01030 [Dellaglioa sp. P0083]|uniref:hypothetical protein n=1 Tax=Dellaglioa kimchii TaxID=3344667 RepID=UPI0038D4B100